MNKHCSKAFTLAEVLITLGVIGIVAALTIPSLIQNSQSRRTVTALKKAFSEIQYAYTLAVQDSGTPDTWQMGAMHSGDGAVIMLNKLASSLKITKNCGYQSGCWAPGNYKDANGGTADEIDKAGTSSLGFAKAQLADGTFIATHVLDGTCNHSRGPGLLAKICGDVYIDVNGYNPPNQIGVDTFYFYLTNGNIIPIGTPLETKVSFDSYCKDKTTAFDGYAWQGTGCTAWVIYNENLDYLKCPGTLSWNGPTTCN